MIVLQTNEERRAAAPLFAGWEETLLDSCLEGAMGTVWADRAQAPRCGLARLGDFAFLAGDAEVPEAQEAARFAGAQIQGAFCIAVPQSEGWVSRLNEAFPGRLKKHMRYATQRDAGSFDREHLYELTQRLPEGCTLRPLGREDYDAARASDWAQDFCSMYPTWEDYAAHSLGVVAVREGELVAGASGYSWYSGGIEIQIDTRKDCRRQGLAAACGAALVLECLRRGLYPGWDAANLASLNLSAKLGYRFSHVYDAYFILPCS